MHEIGVLAKKVNQFMLIVCKYRDQSGISVGM